MAFHVVSSFLLRVLASKTTLWMAGIFQQPIRCFYFMVFEANTHSKKKDTTWKAMKSWVRKCYIFLCTINFEVTWPFWKMWKGINWVSETLYLGFACSFYLHSSTPSHPPFVSGKHCKTCVWWAYGQTTHAQPGSETKNTWKIYVSDSNYQILNCVHQGSFYSKL